VAASPSTDADMSGIDFRQMLGSISGLEARATGKPVLSHPSLEHRLTSSRPRLSPVVVCGLVRATDAFFMIVSGVLVHFLYIPQSQSSGWTYPVLLLAITAIMLVGLQATGCYSLGSLRSFFRTGAKVAFTWTMVFLCATAIVFFLKAGDSVSRVWLASWFVAGSRRC
jgi:hypothetical protein